MFQGVRQLPEGTIVITLPTIGRSGSVGEPFALGRGFYVVSWFVPLWLPLILRPPTGETARMPVTRERIHVGGRIQTLRVLGVLSACVLILGLPLAASRYGVWGFLAAAALLLTLCVAQGIIEAILRRGFGASRWEMVGAVLSSLWPFTAPLAAERVLAVSWGMFPRALLIRECLDEPTFAQFFRRELYDVSHGRAPGLDDDLRVAFKEYLTKATYRTPAPDAPRYCPRCGAGFNESVPSCTDCEDVPLENSRGGTTVG